MKKIILFFAVSFIANWVYGQGEMDAFKLSNNDLSGSARGIAMGGAFGALGGDVTGVSQNPAGIGVYRSSEIAGSLDFSSVNTESNTPGSMGSMAKDSKFNFSFNNITYIGYTPLFGDVQSLNFGFTYNRLKDFGRNYKASGPGLSSSLTGYIANYTNSIKMDNGPHPHPYPKELYYDNEDVPWISVLGYDGYLMDYDDSDSIYVSPLLKGEKVDRAYSASERGFIDTYDFTVGANILDVVYLGFSLSLTDLRYSLDSRHTEEFEFGGGFDLDNRLETSGSGYQVSIGAILRPVDEFRIGLAYHSPTWYNLNDSYYAETEIGYYKADGKWLHERANTPVNAPPTNYRLRTPDRWVGSVAGVFGKKAILSLDYEYTDYSSMKLQEDMYDFSNIYNRQNDFISKDFIGASTLKVGLEYRATPQIALRAGYSWMQSPLEKSFKEGTFEVLPVGTVTAYTLDGDTNYFSYGAGFRFTSNLYMDLAFSLKTQTSQLYTYSPGHGVNPFPSKLKNDTYRGLLTLGYKF